MAPARPMPAGPRARGYSRGPPSRPVWSPGGRRGPASGEPPWGRTVGRAADRRPPRAVSWLAGHDAPCLASHEPLPERPCACAVGTSPKDHGAPSSVRRCAWAWSPNAPTRRRRQRQPAAARRLPSPPRARPRAGPPPPTPPSGGAAAGVRPETAREHTAPPGPEHRTPKPSAPDRGVSARGLPRPAPSSRTPPSGSRCTPERSVPLSARLVTTAVSARFNVALKGPVEPFAAALDVGGHRRGGPGAREGAGEGAGPEPGVLRREVAAGVVGWAAAGHQRSEEAQDRHRAHDSLPGCRPRRELPAPPSGRINRKRQAASDWRMSASSFRPAPSSGGSSAVGWPAPPAPRPSPRRSGSPPAAPRAGRRAITSWPSSPGMRRSRRMTEQSTTCRISSASAPPAACTGS